jgi:hypothetical protein
MGIEDADPMSAAVHNEIVGKAAFDHDSVGYLVRAPPPDAKEFRRHHSHVLEIGPSRLNDPLPRAFASECDGEVLERCLASVREEHIHEPSRKPSGSHGYPLGHQIDDFLNEPNDHVEKVIGKTGWSETV